jgi:hypothetical protein
MLNNETSIAYEYKPDEIPLTINQEDLNSSVLEIAILSTLCHSQNINYVHNNVDETKTGEEALIKEKAPYAILLNALFSNDNTVNLLFSMLAYIENNFLITIQKLFIQNGCVLPKKVPEKNCTQYNKLKLRAKENVKLKSFNDDLPDLIFCLSVCCD